MARVVTNPKIKLGKPILEGTRITVEMVLEELAAGTSVEELVAEHPALDEAGVRAALAYAVGVLRMDDLWPLEHASK